MTDDAYPMPAAPAGAADAPVPPRIQIVPVRGLPFVAIVVVGLIWSIASDSRWALDFYHVAGGGLWTGIDLFVGLVIGPIIGRSRSQLGPSSRPGSCR